MGSALFEKWVINAEFKAKERKVALIIDNCPAYPETENLSRVKLIFLPPNTASSVTMDQGVIRSLKAHYRKRNVRVIFTNLNQDKPIPKISLLKAIQLLVSAWNNFRKETVINCF